MASDLSTYFGNKIIRWLDGNAMPTAPTSLSVALFDGDPKAAGVEVTNDVRAAGRVAVTFTAPASGTDNDMVSDADVDFGPSDSDVDLSHFAIYDNGGNILASEPLAGGPYAVTTGSNVKFAAGAIAFQIGS